MNASSRDEHFKAVVHDIIQYAAGPSQIEITVYRLCFMFKVTVQFRSNAYSIKLLPIIFCNSHMESDVVQKKPLFECDCIMFVARLIKTCST